jgi:adenine-specific DNA-methyltransferase
MRCSFRRRSPGLHATEFQLFQDASLPFVRTGSIRRGAVNGPVHSVIEGENLGTLTELVSRVPGSVDFAFVDPPYQSGGRDLSYRDAHDDWEGDLRARLALVRGLLTRLGVVVIAVDDSQIGPLRVLADDIFGARNHLTTIVHQGDINSGRRFTGGGVDYLVVYGRSKQALMDADVRWREPKDGVEEILAAGEDAWVVGGSADRATDLLRLWWKGRKAAYSAGLREYSRVDERGSVFRISSLAAPGGRGYRYELLHPTTGTPVAPPSGSAWVAPKSTLNQYHVEGRLLWNGSGTPWRKLFLSEQSTQAPAPTFTQSRAEGTKHLKRVFGGEHRFTSPKDPVILARWFRLMAAPDAVFLDPFAGSGTTTEAVMRLNAQDGGTRRSILITNNEVSEADAKRLTADGFVPGDPEWESRGVFRRVLRPRIETIVTGTREDGTTYSGMTYAENVDFFRSEI